MNKTYLSLVLLLFCLAYHAIGQSETPSDLITVSGSGSVKTQPDSVQLTFGLSFKKSSISLVEQDAQNTLGNLTSFFESQGVNATDIQTSYFNLAPNYASWQGEDDGPAQSYTITDTLIVTLRNISNVYNILTGAYSIGINNVQDIQFQVNDIDTVYINARKNAIENAKENAQALANELGVRLTGVYSIYDQTQDYPPSNPAVISTAGSSLAQGVIEIDSTVQVQYFISNNATKNS